jgi:ABC-type uncharacterized transport system permease subunit
MTGGRGQNLRRYLVRSSPVLFALGAALLIGTLVAVALGVAPGAVGARLVDGILLSPYGWGQVLYKATFLTFTGLAVAVAFAGGLFNIGAEGQAVIGSLACALVAIAGAGLPGIVLLPLALVGACAGGALWGILPGWLKARWGTHEVIQTIMLNFIALALSNFLITHFFGLRETVRTAEIGAGAILPRLDGLIPAMRGSAVNASLLLAIVCALLMHVFLHHMPAGIMLRAVGRGRRQAELLGISPARWTVVAFALSGGLAGLVGANFVLGDKHYYEDGFTGGIGFLGIAVALLARNEPLAVLPAALLFGILSQAGFVVNSLLPRELIDILTGVILLVFISAEQWRRRRARHASAPRAEARQERAA